MMRSEQLVRGFVYSFFVATAFTGCLNDAGSNQNERQAGGGDDGVAVERGELAIDPTGQYLISRTSDRLVHVDLSTGEVGALSGLSNAARVTFDHRGATLFVTRAVSASMRGKYDFQDGSSSERGELVHYHVGKQQRVWSRPVTLSLDWTRDEPASWPRLDVTEDDRYLIVSYPERVEVVDASSGQLTKTVAVRGGVADVDVTPDQDRIVITQEHTWSDTTPQTVLFVLDLNTLEQQQVVVPNCSSELVIGQDGKYAFLSPTHCMRDPVSIIDLEAGRFVRNLPGFGPVALAPDGSLAVAFIDSENIEEDLFDDPQQIPSTDVRYHLMLIDTSTLSFDVVELGDHLPRYAITPDGKLLLIDHATLWADGRIRLLDVKDKQLVPIRGAGVQLDHYAMTRDSSKVFLLDDGLFVVDLAQGTAQAALIEFSPTDLNLTPDDALLVLREDDTTLWLYDVHSARTLRSISLDIDAS